jgi:alpha-galactosidase
LLRSIHHQDEAGFTSNREVATELFNLTGAMPYLGDRHTCEFFSCYITSQANMSQYRLKQTTVTARREGFCKGRERLIRMVEGEIEPEYRKRTRETAADIIEAHSQGKVFVDVGNLPNAGQISNLPLGLVVETAVQVDSNGFTPLSFGTLPPVAQAFIEPYAHVFPMTVDACFEKSRKKALQALRLDPVCALLTTAQVNDLGTRLLEAHRQFIDLT